MDESSNMTFVCLFHPAKSNDESNDTSFSFFFVKWKFSELAVLFDIEEEDCYKYCLRKRAAKPDNLVEVKHRPTPSKVRRSTYHNFIFCDEFHLL